MRPGEWFWWALPAGVSAVVAGTMYHVAAEAERGSRAGAEPEVAGVLVALPFVALLLLEVICALWAATAGSRSGRTRCLVVASAGAVLVVVLVLAALAERTSQGYLSTDAAVRVGWLVAALLLPLVPVWLVHTRAARVTAR